MRRHRGRSARSTAIDVAKEAIIQGQVLRGSSDGRLTRSRTPTCACSTGPESSPLRSRPRRPGHFRFFAGPGDWTLRTLAPKTEPVDTAVTAEVGSIREVAVQV